MDMNGDGKPDFVLMYQNNDFFGTADNYHWKVFLNESAVVGVEDTENKTENLSAYPNPTNDFTTLIGVDMSNSNDVSIISIEGKL
jgi:hypothetical protein